jgi:hypothetical protein
MYTPSASRCLRSAARYLTISLILNLWGMSLAALTRDLIHWRYNAVTQGGPYAHERFHETQPIVAGDEIVDIGRRRSATVRPVRLSTGPFEKGECPGRC